MNDLTTAFGRLLADEPPSTLSLKPVVRAGRRGRVVRRVTYGAAGVAAAVAAAAVAVPVLSPAPSRVVPAATQSPAPVRQAVPADVPADKRAVAQAIIDTSPAGFRFDMAADRWSRGGVDATADDGTGASRLLVIAWDDVKPARPCAEPLLTAGGPCTERAVPEGLLSLQENVDHVLGLPIVRATLTRPDGSGVIVEATSYTLTWPLPVVTTEDQKRALFNASRSRPPYTPSEVSALALAVARASS